MSSLRTDIMSTLLEHHGGLWSYQVRTGRRSSGVLMRHDLLALWRDDGEGGHVRRFLLVAVSEHPSKKIALNVDTYAEAKSYLYHASGVKARRARMDVLLAQESFQLTVSSVELDVFLKTKHPVNLGTPRAYWPLTVGVM